MTEEKKWTLIVGLDFSECGTRALNQALQMAHRAGGVVHIAHAVTQADLGKGEELTQQETALEELPPMITRMAIAQMEHLGLEYEDIPVALHVRLGTPFDVVRQVAIDYDADLIVVGTHGRKGVEKLILGSVAEKLVRDANVPVLVAHENRLDKLEKTTFPDPMRHPDEEVFRGNTEGAHVYRSTLISAWRALGRPTDPSL